MKKQWLAFFGALLLGAAILGCDSGQTVTRPDEVPAGPTGAPTSDSNTAAPLDFGNKTPK